MEFKNFFKKTAIGIVAVATCGSTLLGGSAFTFAAEQPAVVQETSSETVVSKNVTESKQAEEVSTDAVNAGDEVTVGIEADAEADTTEASSEAVTEKVTEATVVSKNVTESKQYATDKADMAYVNSLNFSSMRLIVTAKSDKVIVDDSVVVASFDDVYLFKRFFYYRRCR